MSSTNQTESNLSDLYSLFQHSLRLQPNPSTPTAQFHFPQSFQTHYASQHYVHPTFQSSSYTQPSLTPSPPTSSSETPSSGRGYDEDTLTTILRRHSINPTLLSQAQLSLFEIAGHDEQLRLLELWRVAPMTAFDLAVQFGATSVAMEEVGARERWERLQMLEREKGMARERFERSLPGQRAPERSDSFDFGEGEMKMDLSAGYGRAEERVAEPVFGGSGTETEARNRFESWRSMDGLQTQQRVYGSTLGAAEYDDGMEL
ncbi:hypothetical protein MBLNU457_g2911t1 [Dothideomycetes sp. NU457]